MKEEDSKNQCYFTPEVINELQEEFLALEEKYHRLLIKYTNLKFNNQIAREYACNGFARRVGILRRCIQNIYSLCPPDRPKSFKPTRDECLDIGINLQSFVFNVFGCLDNLAWIWVNEKQIKDNNGNLLTGQNVGLMLKDKNKIIIKSFSQNFQTYLKSLQQKKKLQKESWYGNLKKFRHALAHRIPLYVPPFYITLEEQKMSDILDIRKMEALKQKDFDKFHELEKEQEDLGFFLPHMSHSLRENSPIVVFHSQLFSDWNTVVEISERFFEELKVKL